MLSFISRYASNTFSQNGEDGILEECLSRMGIEKGISSEHGAADGIFCSNTRYLLQQGWKGIMIEADNNYSEALINNTYGLDVLVHTHTSVTPENINILLPHRLDVLSIDTDGENDYHCWKAYFGESKIVIIEINSSKDPLLPYLKEGASYITMFQLGVAKGYFLLCHVGNLIFLQNKYRGLFPELDGAHPIIHIEKYFNKSWLK